MLKLKSADDFLFLAHLLFPPTPGRRVTLECEVDGYPTPSIEWSKDGRPLADTKTIRSVYDGRTAALKIYDIQVADQGVYLLRASTKGGAVESRCTVYVEAAGTASGTEAKAADKAPRFMQKLNETYLIGAKEDETITLTVKVVSEAAQVR